MAHRTWSRAVRLLSSLAAEERRGLVIVASISQSGSQSVSRCAARVARRTRSGSTSGSIRVWFGLDGKSPESWDCQNTGKASMEEVYCCAGCESGTTKCKCRTRALPCCALYMDQCGNLLAAIIRPPAVQQQQAAAISRPQAFGKTTLETRLVSCAPWNVAYRPPR